MTSPNGNGRDDFDRVPPHDVGAEQSALGSMLMSKDAIADIVEIIGPDAHYRPAHQIIHEAILDLYAAGEPVDAITVGDFLERNGTISRVGGKPYLHTLISTVPTAANGPWYATIVRERAALRRLIECGDRISQLGWSADGADADALTDRAQNLAYDLTSRRDTTASAPVGDLIAPTLDHLEAIAGHTGAITGVPTGFADLDELLNGLQGGQMLGVGARPGVGKSTLALDFARAAAIRNNMATVIFSLEMGRTEIVMRLLSAEARVPLHAMRAGRLTDDDWSKLARRMGEMQDAPLYIDDSPLLTVPEIRSKCRRLRSRHDLRFVIVDYLQLMSSPKKVENRQAEVAEMSRSLKLLAKELDVPLVALSQLNRGPEQRHDKKPLLSDLRESGGIEQDCDVVILLHREDVHERESPRAGEADLIIAKHRNGPLATVTVAFQGHYSRFVDMAPA